MLRKGRFGDVISRQLDLFEREQAELVRECKEAEATYDRAVDLLADVPNSRPVAFRTPCCDSLNTVSPRFFEAMFNRTTPRGRTKAANPATTGKTPTPIVNAPTAQSP